MHGVVVLGVRAPKVSPIMSSLGSMRLFLRAISSLVWFFFPPPTFHMRGQTGTFRGGSRMLHSSRNTARLVKGSSTAPPLIKTHSKLMREDGIRTVMQTTPPNTSPSRCPTRVGLERCRQCICFPAWSSAYASGQVHARSRGSRER